MKNAVIGGLLIIILLVTPTTVTHAGEKPTSNIVIYIENDTRKTEEDVTDILYDISSNTDKINILLNTRSKTIDKIKQTMDNNAKNKKRMNDEQMSAFKSFSDFASIKNINASAYLNEINMKSDLKHVQRELLHTDTNVSKVYAELKDIYDAQVSAIQEINSVVENGEGLLQIL